MVCQPSFSNSSLKTRCLVFSTHVLAVSSLIAQGSEFPLRKPPGFHWDIFLLGITTFVSGLLGIPFPNGLIPQAPLHTKSLCVNRQEPDPEEGHKGKTIRVADHVVEQRVSNLVQGLMTLVTMTGPLLRVVHLIPKGVLAGLFFVMGVQALVGNGMTQKLLFLARDKDFTPAADPLARLERKLAVWAFSLIQLIGFGATFAITQTIAAIGFPFFIILLIPVRTFTMPKWFRPEELRTLDAPVAGAFVMESVGGAYGEGGDDGDGSVIDDPVEKSSTLSYTPGDSADSAVDNTLERGEGCELKNRSHSQLQRPKTGVRRRSSRGGAGS
jgi:boron transporter